MNDFYTDKIKKYADEIKAYLSGEEFEKKFKNKNGKYLYDRYYDYFIKHTTGGKCLRGYLVFLFERLFGGTNGEKTLKSAAALEVFESAVLMHDDIIDRGRIRRGMPSAYVALGDDHIGASRAICLGDAGLIFALALIEDIDEVKRFLTEIFLRTISGELADIDLSEKREICDNDVIAVFIEKTATYTLLAPCLCGAMLSGKLTDEISAVLHEFAMNAGIAFQIKDDLLGIFGEQKVIGKNNDSDIAEGKKSLLVSHFDKVADDNQKQLFYSVYGKGTPTQNAAKLARDLFTSTGSRQYAEEQTSLYFKTAKNAANRLFDIIKPDENTKQEFFGFMDFLENRVK